MKVEMSGYFHMEVGRGGGWMRDWTQNHTHLGVYLRPSKFIHQSFHFSDYIFRVQTSQIKVLKVNLPQQSQSLGESHSVPAEVMYLTVTTTIYTIKFCRNKVW